MNFILALAVLLAAGPSKVPYSQINGAPINVLDKGADPTGANDSSAAFQAALNTGKDVFCPSGTFKIVTSLYMNTAGQMLWGDCILTMDASLGVPVLWLGAQDATGTASASSIVNIKVSGIQFVGTGTPASGAAGFAFKKATTATLLNIRSWNFYAGVDVRGLALVNTLINPDLRQNRIGLWDRTDGTGTIDFQGSRIIGGRIESNGGEGIVSGTADLTVEGATIEGNAAVAFGAAGTEPEIRLTAGYQPGTFQCIGCHIEVVSSATTVLQVDANACRFVDFHGGFIAAGGAATHYLVNTSSNCTVQGFGFYGGRYSAFKNYVHGAIANNSSAVILPTWVDLSVDATVDLTASAGATIVQMDRVTGLRLGGTQSLFTGSLLFSQLGAATNGRHVYCSDCTPTPTCAGSGTGAFAVVRNAAWSCNGGAAHYVTDVGTITLSSGTPSTGTATVTSGAKCNCTNATTQANPVKCAVAATTLTATGPNTVTDAVTYTCSI